jgi:hypothetical protein
MRRSIFFLTSALVALGACPKPHLYTAVSGPTACGPLAHLEDGNCVANGSDDTTTNDGGPSESDAGMRPSTNEVVSNCESFAENSPDVSMGYLSPIPELRAFATATTYAPPVSSMPCTFSRSSTGSPANYVACSFSSSTTEMMLQFWAAPTSQPSSSDATFTLTTYTFGYPNGGNTSTLALDVGPASNPDWCGAAGGDGTFEIVALSYDATATVPDHLTAGFSVRCPQTGASFTGCIHAAD